MHQQHALVGSCVDGSVVVNRTAALYSRPVLHKGSQHNTCFGHFGCVQLGKLRNPTPASCYKLGH